MQGMKAAAHVQRLEALQCKQQAVLRRKTEEAEAARKRLKVSHCHIVVPASATELWQWLLCVVWTML